MGERHWRGGRLLPVASAGPPSAPSTTTWQTFFFLLLQKEFRCLSSRDKGGRKCDEVCGGGADGGALPVALVAKRGGGDAPVAAGSHTHKHSSSAGTLRPNWRRWCQKCPLLTETPAHVPPQDLDGRFLFHLRVTSET